jgi:nucleoside-diphosphate-sugar epimerase
MNNIKILMTGGSGFIGKPILSLIQSKNIEVCVIGRHKPKGFKGSFIEVDILKISKNDMFVILNKIKPTHLIHLAWYTEYNKFWNAEENISWIYKTISLIDNFCKVGGKTVIAAGSCAEYSWDTSEKLLENSKCEPKNLYGISKNVTRQLASHICTQAGVSLAWCRIFFPYGLGDNEKKFIPSLKKVVNNTKDPFKIKQPGLRDFLHINDIAEALLIILEKNIDGIINICSGIPYDVSDLMIRVLRYKKISLYKNNLFNFNNEKAIVNIVGSNKILKELGWKSKIDLNSYIID